MKRIEDCDLQRADGYGRIVLNGRSGAGRVIEVFQRSPIRILFPRLGIGALERAVLINTAGGLTPKDVRS